MASFTTQLKDEVTKLETNRMESFAEVCAYIKYIHTFNLYYPKTVLPAFSSPGNAKRGNEGCSRVRMRKTKSGGGLGGEGTKLWNWKEIKDSSYCGR